MKKYKVLNPISFGGRRERGEIVEMTDETAKAIGPDYVIEAGKTETVSEPEEVKGIEEMSKSELMVEAEKRGLAKSGSKADLIERIELAEEGADEESEDESEDEESEEE